MALYHTLLFSKNLAQHSSQPCRYGRPLVNNGMFEVPWTSSYNTIKTPSPSVQRWHTLSICLHFPALQRQRLRFDMSAIFLSGTQDNIILNMFPVAIFNICCDLLIIVHHWLNMSILLVFIVCVLFSAPSQKYFMKTSPFFLKGCKVQVFAQPLSPLSREISLSCQTCCDTGGPCFFSVSNRHYTTRVTADLF